MKNEIIEEDKILNLVILLHEKVFKYLKQENQQNIIEEFVENIFILLYKNKSFFEKNKKWEKIEEDVEKILNFKKCDYPSLTNKIKFRYLDIVGENYLKIFCSIFKNGRSKNISIFKRINSRKQ